REIIGGDEPAALLHELKQRVLQRRASGALLGHELERPSEPRLLQPIARLEQTTLGRVDPRTLAHGHHWREHGEAGGMRRWHLNALACQSHRRLDAPRPGGGGPSAPKLVEPGKDPRNRTGADPDRGVAELAAQ